MAPQANASAQVNGVRVAVAGSLTAVELGETALAAIGTKRSATAIAVERLRNEGAFENVESARAALWKLTAADWVEAIAIGVKRRDRTSMKLFAQACKMLGQEGEILQAFLARFGLASVEIMAQMLEHTRDAKDAPPEQVDRDCIDWLEARGYRVLRAADQVKP